MIGENVTKVNDEIFSNSLQVKWEVETTTTI